METLGFFFASAWIIAIQDSLITIHPKPFSNSYVPDNDEHYLELNAYLRSIPLVSGHLHEFVEYW